jgi:hypothetical protein
MMVVVDLARGDASAIDDALEAAWHLQRSTDWQRPPPRLGRVRLTLNDRSRGSAGLSGVVAGEPRFWSSRAAA